MFSVIYFWRAAVSSDHQKVRREHRLAASSSPRVEFHRKNLALFLVQPPNTRGG